MAKSLTDIYTGLVSAERDQMEKAAAAARGADDEADMVKVAAAYDEIGRSMARQYVYDMVKAAMEEDAPPEAIEGAPAEAEGEPEEEELARRKAEILAKLQAEAAAAEGAPPEAAPPMAGPPA